MSEAEAIIDDVIPEDSSTEVEKPVDESLRGFMSKEDWVASGKDENDWRSPREFRERGELIEQKKALERSYENQIKNLNMLHKMQLDQQYESLMQKRDDAIDVADKSEVKRIDKQIATNREQSQLVQDQPAQAAQNVPAEVIEYMEENPWAKNASDPRTIYANTIINQTMAQGKTLASALIAADKAVAAKFSKPSTNQTQAVESTRTAGKVQGSGKLSWGQLTAQEEKYYNPNAWASKEAFLKAVENARKEDK